MHLSKKQLQLPAKEQITIFKNKSRKRGWYMALIAIFILFFGYSFWWGLARLSDIIFYALIVVFMINIGLFSYQKKQFAELVKYLKWKEEG